MPTEALLGSRRQGGEGFVALQDPLLLFHRKWSHAEENSLPHPLGAAAASLFEKLGAALGRLSVELGQPLPQALLFGWRQSLKGLIFFESARLLPGRQGGDAQEELPHRSFSHGTAAVTHLLPRAILAWRRRFLRGQRDCQAEKQQSGSSKYSPELKKGTHSVLPFSFSSGSKRMSNSSSSS